MGRLSFRDKAFGCLPASLLCLLLLLRSFVAFRDTIDTGFGTPLLCLCLFPSASATTDALVVDEATFHTGISLPLWLFTAFLDTGPFPSRPKHPVPLIRIGIGDQVDCRIYVLLGIIAFFQ